MRISKKIWLSLVAFFMILSLFIYFQRMKSSRINVIQDSTVVLEKIEKVLKLITLEAHFSEIFRHEEFFAYDISPFRKKALIRVNAKVSVGFDLKAMDIAIDQSARQITITQFGDPQILSIDDSLDYYDISEGWFNSFDYKDYNEMQKMAEKKIRDIAEKSEILQISEDHKKDILQLLTQVLASYGWDIKLQKQLSIEQINQ